MHLFRRSNDNKKKDAATSTPDSAEDALLLIQHGDEELSFHHPTQAIKLYEQACDFYAKTGDQFSLASTLGRLGNASSASGDYSKAIQYYEQALTYSKKIEADQITCSILGNLGLLAQHRSESEQAFNYFLQALTYAEKLSDTSVLRFTLNNIANTLFDQGKYEQAIIYFEKCLKANQQTDNRRDDAVWLSSMAMAHAQLGKRDKARSLLVEAHQILKDSDNPEAASDIVRVEALIVQFMSKAN